MIKKTELHHRAIPHGHQFPLLYYQNIPKETPIKCRTVKTQEDNVIFNIIEQMENEVTGVSGEVDVLKKRG